MRKLLLTLAIGLWTLDALAVTRYVATAAGGGNDSNSCAASTSTSSPKLTIANAMTCMVGGDTLQIRGGIYTASLNLPANLSGTSWATASTIAAYSGETVTVKATTSYVVLVYGSDRQYIIFDHIIFDGSTLTADTGAGSNIGFVGGGAHHVRFLDCEMTTDPYGFVFSSSGNFIEFIRGRYHGGRANPVVPVGTGYAFYSIGSDCLWDNVEVYDCDNYGFHINLYVPDHPTLYAERNIIRNCLIYNIHKSATAGPVNTAIALLVGGGHANDNLIYNNVIYGTGALGSTEGGIVIGGGLRNKTYNNTVYGLYQGAAIVFGSGGAAIGVTNAECKNNIFYNTAGHPNDENAGIVNPVAYSNNLADQADTGITVVGNPLFVDAVTTKNFHLQSGSPAKDGGITIALVTTDKDGFARPQPAGGAYDIGAYEYIQAIPPPLSTISMTYPNGGENLLTSTPINIRWTSNDVHTVKLEVSRDGGVTYPETIVTGLAQTADSNNVYIWTPTAPRSLTTKIRVTNLFDLQADESNVVATIRGFYVK